MNSSPLVSIICVCYNHQDYVERTLHSVLNQTYKNIEIIIIDDCSEDTSVLTIERYLKTINIPIVFLKNTKNLGSTKTFNYASSFANGDFILDLACDDVLLPNCVTTQVNAFLTSDLEKTALVFGNSTNIDENDAFISDYFTTNSDKKVVDKNLHNTNLLRILRGGMCMNSAAALINFKIFKELGKYDENLFFEDLDYWIRVAEKYNIVFIDKFLTQKRRLSNSLGSQFYIKNDLSDKIDHSMVLIYQKTISKHKKSTSVLKALLKRVHNSIDESLKTKKWKNLFIFGIEKLKIHYYLLFSK